MAMMESVEALYHVCVRLSIPAAAVLGGALVGAQLQRWARRQEREGALGRRQGWRCWRRPGSNHWRMLSAHVATLLCSEVVRSLYLLKVIRCNEAVPVQNYIEISGYLWLHAISLNFILSFRDCGKARDGCTSLFFSLAYASFIPGVILAALDARIHGRWLLDTGALFDTKTCSLESEHGLSLKEDDIFLQLGIIRGITILITTILFIFASYKIECRRLLVVLCPEDSRSDADVTARQNQALKYILSMVVTGVLEVGCDLASWYCTYHYSRSRVLSSATASTDAVSDDLLFGQRAARILSVSLNCLRVMLVCKLVCWGGPSKRSPGSGVVEGEPPTYEVAARMPILNPAMLAILAPPPTYSSLFGELRPAESGRSRLLQAPLLAPAPPVGPTVLKIRDSTV